MPVQTSTSSPKESQGFFFQNQDKHLTFIWDSISREEILVTACDVVNNAAIFFWGDERKKRLPFTGILYCMKTSDEEILIQERFPFPKTRQPRDLARVTSKGFRKNKLPFLSSGLRTPLKSLPPRSNRQRT